MLTLWIVLGSFAFFALLLVLPLRIEFRYTRDRGYSYRVRYLFLTLADSSKPQKSRATQSLPPSKNKMHKKSASKQQLLSFLGLEDLGSMKTFYTALRTKGAFETFADITNALHDLFSRLGRLLCSGVFQKFDLSILVAEEDAADAALHYGILCATVYPFLTILDSIMIFRSRSIRIRCDETLEATDFCFEAKLNYRIIHLLRHLCGLLWQGIRRILKKGGNQA